MSVEFRTSFLGFNRDDVFEYVHKKDAEMKILSASMNDKIKSLEEELSALKSSLEESTQKNADLTEENNRITAELSDFQARADEIESLSRKIGKLYLVSKSSAKSIVERAEENAELINEQTKLRLENIEQTEVVLHSITKEIISASERFVTDIHTLETDLANAKQKVSENNDEHIRISEEFAEIYEKLN